MFLNLTRCDGKTILVNMNCVALCEPEAPDDSAGCVLCWDNAQWPSTLVKESLCTITQMMYNVEYEKALMYKS